MPPPTHSGGGLTRPKEEKLSFDEIWNKLKKDEENETNLSFLAQTI
jgi:hypothetical protein